MQGTEYISGILCTILFPCSKRLNSTHCLMMKTHYKRELQNSDLIHSAHIGYKDFINICRQFTSEPYSF